MTEFKKGDYVQLNEAGRRTFPRVLVQPWEVLGINEPSVIVRVPRTRTEGFRRDSYSIGWLELVSSSPAFSEAQLEQIHNIITEAIDKHIEEYEHPEKKVSVEELCSEEREED